MLIYFQEKSTDKDIINSILDIEDLVKAGKKDRFIYELLQRAHVNYETKTAIAEAIEQITGYLAARNVLSYWCFSPGFSMQELLRQEVRCIILTSGTLSPLSSFTCEMQIPFPVSLENPHIIQKDQIFVSVIDKGPDGVQLSTAYDRRFVPENMSSLGNTIVNLCRVVPHGLLVFFPSYPVLDKTLDYWRSSGHVDRIESMKPMFVEPKGKGTFTEVIDGFYDKVNDSKSNGGSFFAVCRGKASEGLDFADTYGRGVLITGLPYPPRMDPRVVLKMQYLDEMCRNKISGVKYLSGQEWYRQQASRAVNQAIGRVIRHREDYGAIFLCDYRFKGTDVRQQLPSWVRPYVRTYENFGTVVRDAAQFFRVAQKLRPLSEKKMKGSKCENQTAKVSDQAGPACSRPVPSAWESSSSLKAKVFDSHVPSLKRRKLADTDEHSERDGTARLCVQYETEMSSTKTRHMSLLDALDKSDPNRDDDDALVGEEKAGRLSTLSLQHDKRMDDELRGGKRKIRVVQDRKPINSSSAEGKGKAFMMELKRALSQESFKQIMFGLQVYKATDDLNNLLTKAADLLIQDPNTHILLRGLYQFIRPHHKKQFDEKCQLLTGKGCGYKPEHSISTEERALLMKPTVNACVKDQPQSSKDGQCTASLLADIKKAIGVEKTNRLFLALKTYKKTNNYEQMVSTVVGLLTERDEDIILLKRLTMFIPAHHRQQFSEMLTSLTGSVSVPCQDSDEVSSAPVSDWPLTLICSVGLKNTYKSLWKRESVKSHKCNSFFFQFSIMDESSLEQAIETYSAQLQQVEAALTCGLSSSDQADLLKLKEDLVQLIELTESSLVSVKKSQLLASLENITSQETIPAESQDGPQEVNLDNEFTSFYSELSECAGEEAQGSPGPDEDENETEEEEDMSGTKVRAPYYTSWGTLEYHNAMVVCSEEPDGEEARVRVLYVHPTHKSMKPCGFFLEGKCRFMDSCRFSHGEVVCVSELRDFLEADLTNLQQGSSCLAKHEDGIWYPAKITEIEGGFYTVKFDSLLLKEAVLEADGLIPPMRQDENSSSSSDSEDDPNQCDAGFAKVLSSSKEEETVTANSAEFCGWEAHTRGIGSKLLLKMGYELGKGLGKTLSGRVEPVQAVVLPKGRSLDQCAELTQRRTQAAVAKNNPASNKRKMKRKRTLASNRPNVFDFLNSKLGDSSQSTSSPSCSIGGVEAYQGGKSTKRSLNVQLLQTTERMSQVEKEIQRLNESLKRRNGRDAAVVSHVEEKLSASRRLLQQLKSQEQSIQRAQKKADTHKKMTEF
ncbi:Regulator of telomere elongation helicase 1 [Bagarius yarrelli]|uniref:Regulator of telomere elongation helicase 1 homolog n=1 Tax=Bagarius yarrelli TaxID=175774 RepID=A0A556U5T4_BAGYA|nr:Regulator of telomere elongation helicase 1 [Bagarius yarrelli]